MHRLLLAAEQEELAQTVGLAAEYQTRPGLHHGAFERVMCGTVVEDTDIARARTVETVFQTDVVDEGAAEPLY